MERKFKKQPPINTNGIVTFAFNEVLSLGVGYVSYAKDLHETAVVLVGADGIGVVYWVVNGDKRKEVVALVNKYSKEQYVEEGLFGEVVAWACKHPDFNVERSTMGRFNSRCGFKLVKPLLQNDNLNKEP